MLNTACCNKTDVGGLDNICLLERTRYYLCVLKPIKCINEMFVQCPIDSNANLYSTQQCELYAERKVVEKWEDSRDANA